MFRRNRVYLDNAASSFLDRDVIKMLRKVERVYGNPQGANGESHYARHKLEWARWQVATAIGCSEDEVFFTTGASESNAFAKKLWKMKSDPRVHDSLQVDHPQADVVAMSYINNETGAYDGWGIPYDRVFMDLTATIGHVHVDLQSVPQVVGASFSGHKFGGLQGVGVLYIRKDEQVKFKKKLPKSPWSLTEGTPNTLGIYSLGIAIKNACNGRKMAERNDNIAKMILYIKRECAKMNLRVKCHSYMVNITFKHLEAMSAVSIFSGMGVDISAGSACHSDIDKPSQVLMASDYFEDEALRTVRVSLNGRNSWRDIKTFCKTLRKVIENYDVL